MQVKILKYKYLTTNYSRYFISLNSKFCCIRMKSAIEDEVIQLGGCDTHHPYFDINKASLIISRHTQWEDVYIRHCPFCGEKIEISKEIIESNNKNGD